MARIPFSDLASMDYWGTPDRKSAFAGQQNPLVAVHPTSSPLARLLIVACPERVLCARGFHNQVDPGAPENAGDPNAFWIWEDPNEPGAMFHGYDTRGGANGVILSPRDDELYRAILAGNNSGLLPGTVYTLDPIESPTAEWQRRGTVFYEHPGRVHSGLVLDPSDANVAYVVTPRGHETTSDRGLFGTCALWAEDPNDTTWHKLVDPLDPNSLVLGYAKAPVPWSAWCVEVCASDANVLYFSSDKTGVNKSVDGGVSFSICDTEPASGEPDRWRNRGLTAVHATQIVVAPSDPNVFYIGRNDSRGSVKTEDRGRSFWKFFCLTGYQPDCAPAEITYGVGPSSYTKPSSWFYNERTDPNWWIRSGIEAQFRSGIVHPVDPNIAWFATYDAPSVHCSLVVKTTDGGKSLTIVLPDNAQIEDANEPIPWRIMRHYIELAATPDAQTLFVAAADEGVLVSHDGGDTWSVSLDANNPSLVPDPNLGRFVSVTVCEVDPNVVYCASGRDDLVSGQGHVFRSVDGGASWVRRAPMQSGDGANHIRRVIAHPSDPNTVYALVHDYPWNKAAVPDDAGIYRTTDGGTTWTRLTPSDEENQTIYCTAMALDPLEPETIYCAVSEARCPSDRVPQPGIYIRPSDGIWRMLGDPNCHDPDDPNFPLQHIVADYYALTFHPLTGDLYVGTPAGAFWLPRQYILSIHAYPDEDPNDPNLPTGKDFGRVFANGTEIDPSHPDVLLPYGTTVTLDAQPRALREFYGWIGDLPDGTNPFDPQIVITVTRDGQVWALFEGAEICGDDAKSTAMPLALVGFGLAIVRFAPRGRRGDLRSRR